MSSRTETPAFTIRRATWGADRDALRSVRLAVFVQEQGVPEELEWDSDDAGAVHLLGLSAEGAPIATARLLPTGQVGRMAVLPQWRGRGVGTALLREVLGLATARGEPLPFLNAQVSALSFYERQGLVAVGEVFEEAGIPHRRMALSPALSDEERLVPDLAPPQPLGLVLGRDGGPQGLSGRLAIREASLQLAVQAQRSLALFSRDLDAPIYDNAEFIGAVRRLALRRPDLPVRVLLLDPGPAIQAGHRLLPLIQRLSSRCEVRGIPEDLPARVDAFLVVDGQGYVRRPLADDWSATADFHAPLEARRLEAEFQVLWDRAEPHPGLRRLYL
jgi:predicted GNAT family N-acyltransferase